MMELVLQVKVTHLHQLGLAIGHGLVPVLVELLEGWLRLLVRGQGQVGHLDLTAASRGHNPA